MCDFSLSALFAYLAMSMCDKKKCDWNVIERFSSMYINAHRDREREKDGTIERNIQATHRTSTLWNSIEHLTQWFWVWHGGSPRRKSVIAIMQKWPGLLWVHNHTKRWWCLQYSAYVLNMPRRYAIIRNESDKNKMGRKSGLKSNWLAVICVFFFFDIVVYCIYSMFSINEQMLWR